MNQDPIFAGTPLADLTEWQKHMIGEILPMNDPEIDAIDDAHSALKDLDHDAQVRVVHYLIARLGIPRAEL